MYKVKKVLGLLIVIGLLIFAVTPMESKAAEVGADSQEMKLLLKPELFTERNSGYQVYWGMVKNLANDLGIGVKESKHAFREDVREVEYYDTSDMGLTKKNYILRKRIQFSKGALADKCDLTLKYRAPGKAVVEADAVVSAKDYEPVISLQEDYAGFCDGVVGKNTLEMSLSHTLKKIPLVEGSSLADYAEYFPTLSNIGIPLNEPLSPINGVKIKEYKVSPGTLYFDGVQAKVSISLWYDYETGRPIVAEISWECQKQSTDASTRVKKFFDELQEKSQSTLYPGQMKSNFLFNYKK